MVSEQKWASVDDDELAAIVEAQLQYFDSVMEEGDMNRVLRDQEVGKEPKLEAVACTNTCLRPAVPLAKAAPGADSAVMKDVDADNVVHDREGISESVEVNSGGQEQKWDVVGVESCSHPQVLRMSCTACGKRMPWDYGVRFGYFTMDLRFSVQEAARMRESETENVFGNKKLILVLDLDHTLINSCTEVGLRPDEDYLLHQLDSAKGVSGSLYKFKTTDVTRIIKLRPFVLTFLEEASTMFQMYIYTNAIKGYAGEVVKLLDPENKYFNGRVISRELSSKTNRKDLHVVLGDERAVIIFDDNSSMWPRHSANLMKIEPYLYFVGKRPQDPRGWKYLAMNKADESERGPLFGILEQLRKIHRDFFKQKHRATRDVRSIMRKARLGFLKGCKILLRNVPPCLSNRLSFLGKMLGALCTTEYDSSVTHVVTLDAGPEELAWAEQQQVKLLDPEWILDSYEFWHKVPEDLYLHPRN